MYVEPFNDGGIRLVRNMGQKYHMNCICAHAVVWGLLMSALKLSAFQSEGMTHPQRLHVTQC